MKLIYIWIESYQCIKKQGFCLDSSYRTRYDYQNRTLYIEKNDNWIDPILYGDKISVTAIVGDNGAGKSTLLDAIRLSLFDRTGREKNIEGFLVWEDNGKLQYLSFMEDQIKIKGDKKIAIEEVRAQDHFRLIYYSDDLDIKYYSEDFDDGEGEPDDIEDAWSVFFERKSVQQNISTSYLVKKCGNGLLEYFHNDIKWQLQFYSKLDEKTDLPFPVPQGISICMDFIPVSVFDQILDAPLAAYEYQGVGHHGERNTEAFIIGLLKMMEVVYEKKVISTLNPFGVVDRILQWDIFAVFLYHVLSERKAEFVDTDDYDQVDGILNELVDYEIIGKNYLDVSADTFFDVLEELFDSQNYGNKRFGSYLEFYDKTRVLLEKKKQGQFDVTAIISENVINSLYETKPFSYLDMPNEANRRGYVSLKEMESSFRNGWYMKQAGWTGPWDIKDFLEFFESYAEIAYEIDFIRYEWGLSSGENNMFNLFARLCSAIKSNKKNIILLDELDSSFHPRWQQKIVKSLTGGLRKWYPNHEFQMILTTHSPVLLSDIPRENVIFMRKDGEQDAVHTQTFAANIADLYYDSFFMEQGSIGEVAQGSIENLLDAIVELEESERCMNCEEDRGKCLVEKFMEKQLGKKKKISSSDSGKWLERVQKLIDSIGEDIWRYKVNERFQHFLNQTQEGKKQETWEKIKELERTEGKDAVREMFERWQREERNDSN